ncbi:MAG: PAS domain S-box protein, partial [Methylococcales bacterium]
MITKPFGYRVLLVNLALVGIYFLLSSLSLLFASRLGNITLIWLPSGLALSILLLGGTRYLPSIFVGAFVAGIAIGDSIGVSLGIALGNTIEPLLGWWLLIRCLKLNITLNRLRDFLLILFVAAPLSASVSAVCGTVALMSGNLIAANQWQSSAVNWWMGDTLGIVLVTPLIIAWRPPFPSLNGIRQIVINAVLPMALIFLAGQIIFLDWFANSFTWIDKAYLMFLFISWIAVRLGVRGVTIALIITVTQALLGIHQCIGYFANDFTNTHLINFWFYILTLSVVGIALATYITECKQTEIALQESETRFHNLLQDIPSVAVQSYDINGVLHYWNKASEHLYGYSQAEAIGQNIIKLLLPTDKRDSYRQAIQQMFATTQAMPTAELSVLNKSGAKVDIFAYHAFVHAQGHQPEVFCISIDMTSIKQMEEKLRASESRLRSIIDISPVPMALSDKQQRITFVNPAFEQALGYSVNDIQTVGDWWLKAYPDSDYREFAQTSWKNAIEQAARNKKAILPIELCVTCKSGEVKTMLISGAAVEKTFHSLYLTVFYDITAHKYNTEIIMRSEALLRKKDGYQRALLDNFPFTVWFKDISSHFLAVNRAFSKTLGITDPEQLVGKSDVDFYPLELAEHHRQDDFAVLSSRQKKMVEEKHTDATGDTRWFETYKAPVIDVNGEVLGTVGFERDITERKNNETDLRIAA